MTNTLACWLGVVVCRPQEITGSKFEKLCDAVSITLNKNAVVGDRSALTPGGVRIGAPALTSRNFKEADFEKVAEFLHRGLQIALRIQVRLSLVLGVRACGVGLTVTLSCPPFSSRVCVCVCVCVACPSPSQSSSGKKLVDFVNALKDDTEVAALKGEVQAFARTFPMPGWEVSKMKYT
jgi:glycine hydroxymethyltransferase